MRQVGDIRCFFGVLVAALFLSQDQVDRLRAVRPEKARKHFDAELKGFFLELRPSGGASFGVRYYRDGRPRQMVVADAMRTSASDARAAAWQLLRQVAEGRDPVWERRRGTGDISFAGFVRDHYLPHVRARKRSWRTDEAILRNHLLPIFGGVSLIRIRPADARDLQLEFLRAGLAPATVNRRLALLSAVFTCAVEWGQLPAEANPMRQIRHIEGARHCERYITPQQAARLFEQLECAPNQTVANLCRLLLLTGARRSEVARARWEDVDLDGRVLRVPLAKSGKARHIVLSELAVQCIRNLPRHAGSPWLLPAPRTGRPVTGVFAAWDAIRRRVGIPDLRIHDLRHSYASLLVNAGRSLYEVQHLLGHADPRTTQRYAHLSQRTLRDAADIVGGLLLDAAATPE